MTLLTIEPEELTDVLTTPDQLQVEIPQSEDQLKFILESRKTLQNILHGRDRRLLMLVGPCSIHDPEAALEYAHLFKTLAEDVSDRFFLVMRAYFEKPRTTIGWKGLFYDPDLDFSYDMEDGMRQTRQLLSNITDIGVPVGSEVLEMTTSHYYSDYLSWGCIGARTCASPPHRQLASSLPFPIGIKNTTDGNVDTSIQGIISARSPHTFLGVDNTGQVARVRSTGNLDCHIVLRGSENGPNYHRDAVSSAIINCQRDRVHDRLIIDCSHDNSGKLPKNQIPVFESVIQQIKDGNTHIMGAMLESFLHEGTQTIDSPLCHGVSITDPCLDWKTTEQLILSAYDRLRFLSFSVR